MYFNVIKFFLVFIDENDSLTDLLADKDNLQSGQKNTLAVRDKWNDNLFDIKVSSDSLSNSKTGEKNSSMSILSLKNINKYLIFHE